MTVTSGNTGRRFHSSISNKIGINTEQILVHPNYCSTSFESSDLLLLVLSDVSIVTSSTGEQRRRFSILNSQIRSEKAPIMKKLWGAKVPALVD